MSSVLNRKQTHERVLAGSLHVKPTKIHQAIIITHHQQEETLHTATKSLTKAPSCLFQDHGDESWGCSWQYLLCLLRTIGTILITKTMLKKTTISITTTRSISKTRIKVEGKWRLIADKCSSKLLLLLIISLSVF